MGLVFAQTAGNKRIWSTPAHIVGQGIHKQFHGCIALLQCVAKILLSKADEDCLQMSTVLVHIDDEGILNHFLHNGLSTPPLNILVITEHSVCHPDPPKRHGDSHATVNA